MKYFLLLVFFIPCFSFAQHFGTTSLPVKDFPALPLKSLSILQTLDSSSVYSSLNSTQKDWFYWTNYSRSNPKRFWDSVIFPLLVAFPTLNTAAAKSLKADLYNSNSLSFVKPYSALQKISENFAIEMAARNAAPGHTSPSGATFQDRMKSAGIRNCAGENVSFGPSNPVLMLVLLYIDNGVPGLGHRRALLNPAFTEMGIGAAKYADANSIIIQDFACIQQ